MDIKPLVEELKRVKREKERRLDLVVDFSRVRAVLKRGEVKLRIPFFGEYSLTEWAHQQLSEKLGIPKRYYDRMREEKPELLLQNINAWIEEDERRFIRILTAKSEQSFLTDIGS